MYLGCVLGARSVQRENCSSAGIKSQSGCLFHNDSINNTGAQMFLYSFTVVIQWGPQVIETCYLK